MKKNKKEIEQEIENILNKLLEGPKETDDLNDIPFLPNKIQSEKSLFEFIDSLDQSQSHMKDAGLYVFERIIDRKDDSELQKEIVSIFGYSADINCSFVTTRELIIQFYCTQVVKYVFNPEIEDILTDIQKTKLISMFGIDGLKKLIIGHKKISAFLYHEEYKENLYEEFVVEKFEKKRFFSYKEFYINKSDGWELSEDGFVLKNASTKIKRYFASIGIGTEIKKSKIKEELFKKYISNNFKDISVRI